MGAQVFLIDPLDTLFFREGRAFGPEEATDAYSTFPPLPMTLQGVVRSKLLADHCGRWITYRNRCHERGGPCEHDPGCVVQGVVGKVGTVGSLKVRGPWLTVDGRALLPIPADVMAPKKAVEILEHEPNRELETFLLEPGDPLDPNAPKASNMPDLLRALRPRAGAQAEPDDFGRVEGWMEWDAWKDYLNGEAPKLTHGVNWWTKRDLWADERRPGLTMDSDRNRHREHHLYFAHHVRMTPKFGAQKTSLRLAFECDGLLAGATPVGLPAWAIGGESRAARVAGVEDETDARPWTDAERETIAEKIAGRLKIVLLQPAWFDAGWYPEALTRSGGRCDGWSWAGALVDRARPAGGWDIAQGREKMLRPLVPAGSVFYLESAPGTLEPSARIWNQCISDNPKDNARVDHAPAFPSIGYGHALCGTW